MTFAAVCAEVISMEEHYGREADSGDLLHTAQADEEVAPAANGLELPESLSATCSLRPMVLPGVDLCISTPAVDALSLMERLWISHGHLTRHVAPSWTAHLQCFSTGNHRFSAPLAACLDKMMHLAFRDNCCLAGKYLDFV